jgi:ABC-2 type transport system ATP-binding protein
MTAFTKTKPAILARGLCRHFGRRVAVRDIDLELGYGEILGFLGPNGAGKSTVMRMLTGNLAPSAGSIEIGGIDLVDRPEEAKKHFGYLPEMAPLYRELTVTEYLRFAARLHRVNTSRIPFALNRVMKGCGLGDSGNRLIGLLSKGYQQRVGIAQAIIHDPEVIILDEPTGGLDPNQIREIRALIRELGDNRSVIISTHIMAEVESLCDRVQIINDGHTVFTGRIAMLKQQGISVEEVFVRSTMNSESQA